MEYETRALQRLEKLIKLARTSACYEHMCFSTTHTLIAVDRLTLKHLVAKRDEINAHVFIPSTDT